MCLIIYNNFAYVYDKLTLDIDYKRWADYVESIFKRNNLSASMVLELGCGTGSFGVEMARRGYDMICLDLSSDMLDCAAEKAKKEDLDILFLNQNMCSFELYGTVDAIVCLLDSFNYLTNSSQINKMFKLVKNYLNPGGLFIFDVNTQYKFENTIADNLFYEINDEVTYIWENDYNKKTRKARFDLTFFVKKDELYERFDETHYEKAYYDSEIMDFIKNSGMEFVSRFGELTLRKPSPASQRNFYVCRK
ncbi:Methyltransferase type 12 [Ruminiclostridium papyrosolvens DSM 2782]|uniref:Methyltransferase type 12 n=1 Tax=Ruminiclostridium papyrosolvens DSM 2782 TaxID=588581 RepID=F1TGU6_9FIRM|nr:class I SAM-dependent methyltransferase [Ruminiclostridium papyrosolvens]EGD46427.1 Methyltransferase type 12 [Ruminiclostridium papyrosolvens DSM 2782]WES33960.1 class I SAM-dependent methyltransferase [Ruminiclostridium papyrosolvens DSM 2782]